MAKDYTVRIEPVLRPLLRSGERLVVASPLVPDPGSTEDVSVSDELKNLFDPTILIGLGSHPGTLLQRATFGRALIGGEGTLAMVLFETITAGSGAALAVTDARLLIYVANLVEQPNASRWQRWFGPAEYSARLLFQVDRCRIAGAISAPAGILRRGRFLIVFLDGSAAALVCVPPRHAVRAVGEIGAPWAKNAAKGEEVGDQEDHRQADARTAHRQGDRGGQTVGTAPNPLTRDGGARTG